MRILRIAPQFLLATVSLRVVVAEDLVDTRQLGTRGAILETAIGSSFELFVDLTLIVAIGLALALLGRRWRPALLRVSALVGLAYAACLPILVPIAVLALSGQHAPLRYSPANFSIDVFNVAIPTPTLLAGMFDPARAFSEHFVSNVGEQNGYLGIPLLVVAADGVESWQRIPDVWRLRLLRHAQADGFAIGAVGLHPFGDIVGPGHMLTV